MYINIQSPVLEEMLVYDHQNDIVHLEISDANTLKEYFAEKVIQSLMDRKRLLVVIPDTMDPSVPSKILTNYQLAHFSAVWSTVEGIDISERIRTLKKLTPIPLIRQEYEHVLLRFKELNNKIYQTLQSITKGNIKRPAFKDMLLSIKPRPKTNISESVIDAISSIDLNAKVLDQLDALQKKYQANFVFMDSSSSLTKAYLEDQSSFQFAKDELSFLHLEISQSILNIEKELFLMKRVIAYELEEEIGHWSKVTEELQEVYLENEIDNQYSSFEETACPIIDKLRGLKYLKFSLPIVPEKGWGQVSDILNVIHAIIDSAKSSSNIYFNDYVHRLSPFNTANKILDQHIDQGIKTLKKINNSKYIDFSCNTNFLQVDTLLSSLKEAQKKSFLCTQLLANNEYVEFKKAVKQLNIEQTVLESLYSLNDENWRDILEFYGQRSHLIESYNSNMTRLEEWTTALHSTHQVIKHTCRKELHNRWCVIREQAINKIRNNNWEKYKEVFDSSDHRSDFNQMSTFLGDSLFDFFPITIIRSSELKGQLQSNECSMENVFYLDPKDVDEQDITLLKNRSCNITIASTYSIDLSMISKSYDIVSNYCSESRIVYGVPLDQLDKTERYKFALSLSTGILSVKSGLNIYKIGDQVVMSLLNPLLDCRVQKELDLLEQNILFSKTSELAHLIETLIHYDNVCLLTENNLLNDQNGSTSLWQRNVIHQLEECGVKILNLNTHDLYNDLYGNISKLIDSIKSPASELIQTNKTLVVSEDH